MTLPVVKEYVRGMLLKYGCKQKYLDVIVKTLAYNLGHSKDLRTKAPWLAVKGLIERNQLPSWVLRV